MSSLVQSRFTVRTSEASSPETRFITIRILARLSRLADAHPWSSFAAVTLLCSWRYLQAMLSRHLGHDELFTYYIAGAPNLRQLFHLTRTVDLHPPLSFLLVRASFSIFGPSAWACRLPFLLAFLLASCAVFWFVRRVLSAIYGLIAALIWWSIPLAQQSADARPYALLLCSTAIMFASWYEAAEDAADRNRTIALMVVSTSGFALLLSHVLALLSYSIFLAVELVRFRIRRKPDWPLWIALAIPLPVVLTYLPLLHTESALVFAEEYRATPLRIFCFYWESMRGIATPFISMAMLWLLRSHRQDNQANTVQPTRRGLGKPAWLVLAFLSLVPIAVGILFAHTGTAFFDRYGIVWMIPLSLMPVLLFGRATNRNPVAASGIAVIFAVALFFNTAGKPWLMEQFANIAPAKVAVKLFYAVQLFPIYPLPSYPAMPAYLGSEISKAPVISNFDKIRPDLPLVAHTGLTFLEMDHEESPAVAQRLYYLTDATAASAIAHDTVFAHYELLKEVFPIRGKVEPYCSFVSAHREFLVVGAYNNPQGWLLRKLDHDGAKLQVVGVCRGYTEECQLYQIHIANPSCE